MSEPLKELRAQRDLIQTHLTWLDTQIVLPKGAQRNTQLRPINRLPYQALPRRHPR